MKSAAGLGPFIWFYDLILILIVFLVLQPRWRPRCQDTATLRAACAASLRTNAPTLPTGSAGGAPPPPPTLGPLETTPQDSVRPPAGHHQHIRAERLLAAQKKRLQNNHNPSVHPSSIPSSSWSLGIRGVSPSCQRQPGPVATLLGTNNLSHSNTNLETI